MGGMGLIFIPVLVRRLLGPLGLSGPMISTLNNHIGRYNPPPAAHPPHPLPLAHPLMHLLCDVTVVLKKSSSVS